MDDLAIETFGLSRKFGNILAVNNLSLCVPRSSIYGFLGPNGAGKTTTIRMLLGLIRPNEGSVTLLGKPLSGNHREILGRIGALVETPSLYPHLTGQENLRVVQELVGWPKSRIDHVLDTVGLSGDANRLVAGYSLGMRQRLALAKALLGEPELLILDEPTNGLDPAGIREMRALIRRFPEEHGVTVFLSSHLLAEVEQLATWVGVIGQGHLLFQGAIADLQGHQRMRAVIEVDQPGYALAILRRGGWEAQISDDGRISVPIANADKTPDLVEILTCEGLRIFELRRERPSLEESFLELTRGSSKSVLQEVAR